MAARIPPAARRLVDQVTAEMDTDPGWWVEDDADGFGRHRSVVFDKDTATWLLPVLEANKDKRIESFGLNGEDNLVVTFVADVRADRTQDFVISEARAILAEPEPKPTKKAAAKKAARKRPAKKSG